MGFRDLVPWSKNQAIAQRGEQANPFLTLHREMNRLFDDMWNNGFDGRLPGFAEGRLSWPSLELSGTEKALKVTCELPGLDEKDVEVELANGALVIRGEKKLESDGDGKVFSERYYGSFERQVSLEGVQEDKVEACFKNGVLTITLPKLIEARSDVRR